MRKKENNRKKDEDTLAMDTDAYIDREGDPGLASEDEATIPYEASVSNGGGNEDEAEDGGGTKNFVKYEETGQRENGYLLYYTSDCDQEEEEEGGIKEKKNIKTRRANVVVKKEEDEEVVFVKETRVSTNTIHQQAENGKDESEGEIAEGSEGEIESPSAMPVYGLSSTCPSDLGYL